MPERNVRSYLNVQSSQPLVFMRALDKKVGYSQSNLLIVFKCFSNRKKIYMFRGGGAERYVSLLRTLFNVQRWSLRTPFERMA
jgi:hypothetical protein